MKRTDEQIESTIKKAMLDDFSVAGKDIVEIHQSYPADRSFIVHTDTRTFIGLLTPMGMGVKQLYEEK